MNITIDQFKNIAKTGDGYIGQDPSKGAGLRRYGRGILGKIVMWLRVKLYPGEVSAENRAVMKSFVAALRERYGEEFASIASRKIDLSGARPLSARTVRSLIAEADQREIASLNKTIQSRFSEKENFVSIWNEILEAKGIKEGFKPEEFSHEKLSRKIAIKIQEKSNKNTRIVSDKEAEKIAREEIDRFITDRKTIMDRIGTLGLTVEEQARLMDMVRRNENIRSIEEFDAIWTAHKEAKDFVNLIKQAPPPDRTDVLKALNNLSIACNQGIEPLVLSAQKNGKEFGADESWEFRDWVLQLGMSLAGVKGEEMQRIFEFLSSPEIKELWDVLQAIHAKLILVPPGMKKLGYPQKLDIQKAISMDILIALTLNQAGQILQKELKDAMNTPNKVDCIEKIPPDIIEALKNLDFGIVSSPT